MNRWTIIDYIERKYVYQLTCYYYYRYYETDPNKAKEKAERYMHVAEALEDILLEHAIKMNYDMKHTTAYLEKLQHQAEEKAHKEYKAPWEY